jgi:hypothetical protein
MGSYGIYPYKERIDSLAFKNIAKSAAVLHPIFIA